MNFKSPKTSLDQPAPENMQKVLVSGTGEVLAEAVERLLGVEPIFEITRLPSDHNADDILHHVEAALPNVVIVCQETDEVDTYLLFRLLQYQINLRVIVLSLESNQVQVFDKSISFLRNVNDLVLVVESKPGG